MPSTESGASAAGSSSPEAEPAVLKAQSAFRATAGKQLKRLMAEGVERDTASVQLMDQMLHHGAGAAACSSACASPQVEQIVSMTGFTQVQAAKTLLLKEEIAQLRRQGHSTAALIEQLQKRLRFTAQPSSRSESDENSTAPRAQREAGLGHNPPHNAPHNPPHKKLKRDDDVPHELLWPPLQAPGLRGGLVEIGGGGLAEMRPTMKKRHPDDAGPPLHKRPKTRLPALPLEACDAPPPAPT